MKGPIKALSLPTSHYAEMVRRMEELLRRFTWTNFPKVKQADIDEVTRLIDQPPAAIDGQEK